MPDFKLTASLEISSIGIKGTGVQTTKALKDAFSGLTANANKSAKAVSDSNKAAQAHTASIKKSTGAMFEFGKSAGLALKRYSGFVAATAVTFGLVRAISAAWKETVQFEREMNKVTQVTGSHVLLVGSLRKEITRLSKDLGASSKELATVSRLLTQAGMGANDARVALEALAKSALAPTFGDIKDTTEGLIAVWRQFRDETRGLVFEAQDYEKVLGMINATAGKTAVEAKGVIEAIKKSG